MIAERIKRGFGVPVRLSEVRVVHLETPVRVGEAT